MIHTSDDFGLYENCGHMNFYTNTEFSKVDTCKDIRERNSEPDRKVILYENDSSNSTTEYYEEVDFKDLDIGSNPNSALTKRSITKSLKDWFKGLHKRVFDFSLNFFVLSIFL